MCSECECWQLFYPKQKFNEQEKKLLIAYLDTIDYSCGSSFYNAENLFGFQKEQSINNKSDNNTEIESDTELVVTRSELKNKKHVSNEIELSNIENNSDYDNSLLNQNEADNLQSDSEIWENLFYRSNDVNSELADNNESDDYDSYELANSNESEEDLNGSVDSEESDDSEAKSLTDFELLDADKPTIKQIFEKVFINDGLTCNSPIEKAYYSAQIFSLLCYECGDTNIVIPIPVTQYPLCEECTQKGIKTPTRGKSLKFTAHIHKKKRRLSDNLK
ncbi:hypothetical protein F8M41_002397 [Gigaspora margarita]|uniref:Uncharacterized protein n=1 Tax=Gigaspora margarita TaxID=4874 RepID=A0A8H3XEC7_GIGMA|nr:hypothetical protein F8M41_002397 [Gigaspora margarita]